MKARLVLLVFAVLSLLASFAVAAPPAGNGTAEAVGPMTAATPADESPACDPLLAELGISAPGSPAQNASTLICGACSQTICRGAALGSICQGGTQVKKCTWVYGDSCPVDGQPRCLCWSGPLP